MNNLTLSASLGKLEVKPVPLGWASHSPPRAWSRGCGASPVGTYHADELGQGKLELDGDELGGAGGWADQVIVAGFVQKVIDKLLLCIGHAAVPWEDTHSQSCGALIALMPVLVVKGTAPGQGVWVPSGLAEAVRCSGPPLHGTLYVQGRAQLCPP